MSTFAEPSASSPVASASSLVAAASSAERTAPTSTKSLPGWVTVSAVIVMVAVALAIRWPLRNEISGDYRTFIGPWYDYIAGHGGLAALRDQFSNYNPPYLYLVVVATWLPVPKIVAIKLVSVAFDLLLAYAVHRIVSLVPPRTGRAWQPLAAAATVLLLPTVVLNSSYWGQCDSIYASLGLLALYQQLRRRTGWAAVFIGLAIAFKLQAVFLLPVLAMVWVTQPIRWRRSLLAMALIPATFVVMLLPALAAGASPAALAGIYPAQIGGSGQGGPGQGGPGQGGPGQGGPHGAGSSSGAPYTRNAASFYQWLSADSGAIWRDVGFALVAVSIGLAIWIAWRHRHRIGTRTLVAMAATQLVAIPFFLPEMHDRYFYLADALLVAAAFAIPRLIPAAVAAQGASLIVYGAYLWNGTISLRLATTLEFVALIGCIWAAAWCLRQDRQTDRRFDPAGHPYRADEDPPDTSEPPVPGVVREPAAVTSPPG